MNPFSGMPQIFFNDGSGFTSMTGIPDLMDSLFGDDFSIVIDKVTPSADCPISYERVLIESEAEQVIVGFLNLDDSEGWKVLGNDARLGAAFVRCILSDYCKSISDSETATEEEKEILDRTLECFENIGSLFSSPFFKKQPEDGHRPKTNRVRYDEGVSGWKDHAVCRMVGNIASKYNSGLPFFEILVNSARSAPNKKISRPFYVTVHRDEKVLDHRRSELAAVRMLPSSLAHFTYYSSSLQDPETFMENSSLKFGSNAKRLINGLTFLNEVQLYAQKTGNCWIKQPMRCLLAGLYLEIFSLKKDFSPSEAWEMAKLTYKDIQKKSGIPLIRELLDSIEVTESQREIAERAIKHRLSL